MYEIGNSVEIAKKIINEIKLTAGNIDSYEDCEIIVDLMDENIINQINDTNFRKLLQEMRRLHSEIRKRNYPAYINMAIDLFSKIPNNNHVLKYHQLEQLCRKINDEQIIQIKDIELRETLKRLTHIHDDIALKKANIIKKMKLY